jgi:outer membrane protein insertion porin family
MTMKALVTGLSLVFALSGLSGCASKPPASPAKPPAPAASAKPPVPPCPESILPGGDPLEATGFEGKPVVRVCVVGGSESSRQAAQRAIELRPSEVFSAERMRSDLDALLKLGIFDDAAAYGLRVQQGASVVLLYSIHDRPLVSDIAFEGAKLLGDATLNAKLPIAKESPYDPAKAAALALGVRNEYRLRGYDAARVVVVAEPAAGAPDHVRVRLKVDEGVLSRFAKIEFKGNKKVAEAVLRKTAALEVGKPVVHEEIEHAALLLNALYYDRGFIQVRVDTETGTPDAQGAVPLTFVVDEGDTFTIGKLHATKLGAPLEKELLDKVVRVRPKQLFVRTAVVQDLERVSAFFAGRNQQVVVTPLTEIDAKTRTIDLTFEIAAP